MIKKAFRLFRIGVLAALVVLVTITLLANAVQAKGPAVVVLTLKGIINPVTADYIKRGLDQAEKDNATAVIIQMDTPGGLDKSMREMIQNILASPLPVVVYVGPSGARAASAGTYITLSAHIAAMAPNTTIGAASPVALTSTGVTNVPSTEETKVLNDAVAYIRNLADTHGRNPDWAEKAVREAADITDTEAISLHVVDLVATDLDDLLKQINGRTVTLLNGPQVTITTTNAPVAPFPMSWTDEFLLAISDPDVAFILLGLAGIGLWVEIVNPGLVFPGVFGAISLILALFSLGNLPVNLAGVLLLVLAFVLFLIEGLVIPGFGAAGIGGIISLVLGALILFKGGPMFQVNPWLIAVVAICFAAFLAFIIFKLVRVRRLKVATGYEELIDAVAEVREPLNPKGLVFYRGELWAAVSETGRIETGELVTIKKIDGLKLYVTRTKKEEK